MEVGEVTEFKIWLAEEDRCGVLEYTMSDSLVTRRGTYDEHTSGLVEELDFLGFVLQKTFV